MADTRLAERAKKPKPENEPEYIGLNVKDVVDFLQSLFDRQVASNNEKVRLYYFSSICILIDILQKSFVTSPEPVPRDKGKSKAVPESRPQPWEQEAQRLFEGRLQMEEDQVSPFPPQKFQRSCLV